MIERRRRDLDLPPRGELAIDGYHVADHFDLLAPEQPLIFEL